MTKEKTVLIGVDFRSHSMTSNASHLMDDWTIHDQLDELEELVLACNAYPAGRVICPVVRPTPRFLIGSGKVEEIAAYRQANAVDLVVFSQDLKGSQQRNLEEAIGCRVIDRTEIILDIFARRAVSLEGKMQVELAQLEYLLPRLVGHGLSMSRQGGGIGTRGPGETKLETDRRRIGDRVAKLKSDLKEIALDHQVKRKKRKDKHLPCLSLVGYTNAGKSTLLNTLTGADQITKNGLFTTLDSLSRQMVLPNRQQIVVSDTVGFMHSLPHHLIEAFKTTLEEVKEADLLLHVVDVSHRHVRALHEAVLQVLGELDCLDKPRLTVLNKIDQLTDQSVLPELIQEFENAVAISALQSTNLEGLLNKIQESISEGMVDVDVKIPLTRMDLVNLVHQQGKVEKIDYSPQWIHIKATVPVAVSHQLTQA